MKSYGNDYRFGMIGNGRTTALIDELGTIIFACMPDLDSGTVFGALLDREQGGEFGIAMADGHPVGQEYERHTNILVTHFEGESGSFDLIDFMPRYTSDKRARRGDASSDIVRVLRHRSGEPRLRINYRPRLEYARFPTESFEAGDFIKSTSRGCHHRSGEEIYESLYLFTDLPTADVLSGEEFSLKGDRYLLVSYHDKVQKLDADAVNLMLQRTRSYWLLWSARTHRPQRFAENVLRSASRSRCSSLTRPARWRRRRPPRCQRPSGRRATGTTGSAGSATPR
ncbi:MAG: trehalase-like domain-containing protein [Verrucomicrobiales bacterium]